MRATSGMSAVRPYRCTGTMARVFDVIAASILVTSILRVLGSQSTNTGVAPASQMASAVAKKVLDVVMISSPGPRPKRQKDEPQRVGAGVDADGFLRLHVTRQFFFELDQLRAEHITAALEHVEDGLIDLSLQVVVLLHVAIKTDA